MTGILAGVLYRFNFLGVKSNLLIPKFVANWSNRLIGTFIESRSPRSEPYPQGATLDIQRQIRTDYLEQRFLLLQARQNRQGRIGVSKLEKKCKHASERSGMSLLGDKIERR